MNEVREGLFELEEQMPCPPKEITLDHYVLHAVQGYAEREEATARILSFSKQLDKWVGVSWSCLAAVMQVDIIAYLDAKESQNAYYDELQRVLVARAKYYTLRRYTLGVYELLVRRPTVLAQVVPDTHIPMSLIYTFGVQSVLTGIQELIDEGMLRLVHRDGESERASDVFFPTPSLVSRVMQKQSDIENSWIII